MAIPPQMLAQAMSGPQGPAVGAPGAPPQPGASGGPPPAPLPAPPSAGPVGGPPPIPPAGAPVVGQMSGEQGRMILAQLGITETAVPLVLQAAAAVLKDMMAGPMPPAMPPGA